MSPTTRDAAATVSESPGRERRRDLAVLLVALIVFVLSPVGQFSDSHYSLLLSESLYKHGTFALDRYVDSSLDSGTAPTPDVGRLPHHIVTVSGHDYYAYPPGSSVLSVPLVMLLNAAGMSAIDAEGRYNLREERRMQRRIAAILMAVLTLVVYRTARGLLSHPWSLGFAFSIALGTQVWSTASRGMWSHTWAITLTAVAVCLLVAHDARGGKPRPVVLGTLMVWAYFARPTMAVGLAAVGVLLLVRRRRELALYTATVAVWWASFALWSWLHFGHLVPRYFRDPRLGSSDFWSALAGNLVSPSRGLVVFSPFLVAVGYLLVRYGRYSRFSALAVLGVAATAGHVLVVALWPAWWGGHGYGPRLLTDAVPWVALASLVAIHAWRTGSPPSVRRGLESAALGTLLAIAILMHGVGALSSRANEWNRTPVDIDRQPSRAWDWSDPQFLAPLLRGTQPSTPRRSGTTRR